MSQAAEQVRVELLRQQAGKAVARAERLGAYLQRIWDGGGEPSASLVNEFERACARAEVLLLERALALSDQPVGVSPLEL